MPGAYQRGFTVFLTSSIVISFYLLWFMTFRDECSAWVTTHSPRSALIVSRGCYATVSRSVWTAVTWRPFICCTLQYWWNAQWLSRKAINISFADSSASSNQLLARVYSLSWSCFHSTPREWPNCFQLAQMNGLRLLCWDLLYDLSDESCMYIFVVVYIFGTLRNIVITMLLLVKF